MSGLVQCDTICHSCRGKPSPSLECEACISKRVLIDVFSLVVLLHGCSSSPTPQANPGVGRDERVQKGHSMTSLCLSFLLAKAPGRSLACSFAGSCVSSLECPSLLHLCGSFTCVFPEVGTDTFFFIAGLCC